MTFSKQLPWQDIWLLQNSNSVWATKRSVNGLVSISFWSTILAWAALLIREAVKMNFGSLAARIFIVYISKCVICGIHPSWAGDWKESFDFNLFHNWKAVSNLPYFQFCIFAFMWSVLMIKQHFIISWIHWTCFANWQKQPSSWNDICIKCCTLCCGWTDICTMCVLQHSWSWVTTWNLLWGLGIVFPLRFSAEYQLQNVSKFLSRIRWLH